MLNDVLHTRFGVVDRWGHRYVAGPRWRGENVVELGAGSGSHLGFEDLDGMASYTAVELTDIVVGSHPKLHRVVGDCQQTLPLADGSVDRVIAVHVFEHLEDLPAALTEVQRILKPGGTLKIVIPCEGGRLYRAARAVTTKRMFEHRYGVPYDFLWQWEHINQAREILDELARFEVVDRTFFPLRVPSVDLNLVVGVTLRF